jgi:hypothetical protein
LLDSSDKAKRAKEGSQGGSDSDVQILPTPEGEDEKGREFWEDWRAEKAKEKEIEDEILGAFVTTFKEEGPVLWREAIEGVGPLMRSAEEELEMLVPVVKDNRDYWGDTVRRGNSLVREAEEHWEVCREMEYYCLSVVKDEEGAQKRFRKMGELMKKVMGTAGRLAAATKFSAEGNEKGKAQCQKSHLQAKKSARLMRTAKARMEKATRKAKKLILEREQE